MHDATCCYPCSLPACLVKPCADVPHSHALQLCWKVSRLVTRALLLFVVLLCMSLKMHASSLKRWPCFRGLSPLGGVGTGARLTPSSPTLAPIAGLQCCYCSLCILGFAPFAFMVTLLRFASWMEVRLAVLDPPCVDGAPVIVFQPCVVHSPVVHLRFALLICERLVALGSSCCVMVAARCCP